MNGILISTSAVVIILAVIVILSLLVLYQFYSTRVLTQKIVNVLEKGKDSQSDSVEVAIVNDIIITIKSMETEVLRIYMPGEYRDGIYKGCENAIKAIKMIVPRRVQ